VGPKYPAGNNWLFGSGGRMAGKHSAIASSVSESDLRLPRFRRDGKGDLLISTLSLLVLR
jgi:hypothetical protein